MDDWDRRMNIFVDFVNENRPKEELVPPIQNEEEDRIFDNMGKELAEARTRHPDALLAHFDSEWGPIDSGYNLD